jgi:hypothetical protein
MRIFLVMFAIAALGMVALGQNSRGEQPFKIVLSSEKPSMKVGSPVLITLQLTNTSDHGMFPGWGGADNLGVFDSIELFDVRDSLGHSLQKRERNPSFPLTGSSPTLMKPGETRSYYQDLTRRYDLSLPGEYTIQVSRPISENKKDVVVKSNKITITITK